MGHVVFPIILATQLQHIKLCDDCGKPFLINLKGHTDYMLIGLKLAQLVDLFSF